MKLKHRITHHFHKTLKANHSDHEIALGFSLGTFFEIFFIVPGLGLIISILVLLTYSKLSKYALLFAILFWNVLFIAPIYILSYQVGNFLFEIFPSIDTSIPDIPFADTFLPKGKKFLVGHFLVSTIFSIMVYLLARWFIKVYRRRLDLKK